MLKKMFLSLLITSISAPVIFANTTIQQIQSPIYVDDIGRSHFLGRGGYSSVRSMQMGDAYSSAINEVTFDTPKTKKKIESTNNTDFDITKVIEEKTEVPVTSKTKVSTSSEERRMDASASFGQGATNLSPNSGVNNSKTIYTDDLGRLHFFGKNNIIRE